MADQWEHLRSLPFLTVASALGWDVSKYKARKNGLEHFGPCFIHQSKNNHTCFSYHQDGKWRCFSCPAKGSGSIDLVKSARGCNFQDATAFLQALGSQPSPKPQSPHSEANGGQCEAPSGELKPFKGSYAKFFQPCEWLEKRVPDKTIRERYGVGYYNNPARKSAYSGRVMLPFMSLEGELFGYMGRAIEGEPKYLVPAAFPKGRFLFGAHQLKGEVHRIVWVVESPFTVMKFASFGLPCVALYGWSVSDEQLQILQQLTKGIIYLPDANKVSEAESYAGKMSRKLWVRMPEMPVADPELMTHSQILAL